MVSILYRTLTVYIGNFEFYLFISIIIEIFQNFLIFCYFRQSYDIVLTAEVGTMLAHNTLDLKNPFFRYTAAAVIPPAGFNNEAPSDNLLQQNGIIIFSLDILGGRFISFLRSLAQNWFCKKPKY